MHMHSMRRMLAVSALAALTACSTAPVPQTGAGTRDWHARSPDGFDYLDAPLQPAPSTVEVPAARRGEAVTLLEDVSFRRLTSAETRHLGGNPLRGRAYLLRAFRFTDRIYGVGVYRRGTTVRTHAGAMGKGPPLLERTAVIYYDSRPITRAFADYGLTL